MAPPRRPRPGNRAAGHLTREKLIEAGLGLIDREGPDAITMRRLAGMVGVTPMALYNHVSSKQDLLRAVAEHVLGQAEFDDRHADWREQVRHCFRALRGICLRHPGLARLLETADVPPAAVFAPMEVTLRALGRARLDNLDALRTYFTLVSFTLGQASYETRGPFPDLEPSEKVRSERLAGRGYRTVERLDTPPEWDFEAAFEFGLGLILAGVEAAARSRPGRRGSRPARPANI